VKEFGAAWGFGVRGRCRSDMLSKLERTDLEAGKNQKKNEILYGTRWCNNATKHMLIAEARSTSKTFEICIERI